jgi:hypothetical protein
VEIQVRNVFRQVGCVQQRIRLEKRSLFTKVLKDAPGVLNLVRSTPPLCMIAQPIAAQIFNKVETTAFQFLEEEAQGDLLMLGVVTAIIDDEIETHSFGSRPERLKLMNAALVCDEGLDPIVVKVRTWIDVDAKNTAIGKVVIPHLQRGTACVPALNQERIPPLSNDAQANLKNCDGSIPVSFYVGLIDIGVIVGIAFRARSNGAFIRAVQVC